MIEVSTVYVNLVLVGINLFVFRLSLKLYTEYFKDKSMDKRTQKTREEKNGD